MRAQFWIVAGPNGAGKSTLVAQRLAHRIEIVNPDDIARALDPVRFNEPAVVVAAGREAVAARRSLLAARRSFGVETTLTGASSLNLMREAREAGFKINLVFIGLQDAVLSKARVNERVADGGHSVPAVDIERRFPRSLANLSVATTLADRYWIFDNSGLRTQLLASVDDRRVRYVSKNKPKWAAPFLIGLTLGLET